MSAGELSVYGEWLVQEAKGCTCQGSDAHYGHQQGCGYEPLVKINEIKAAFKAAGYAVVELPKPDEEGDWFVLDVGSTCVNEGGVSMVVPFTTQLTTTATEARQFAASLLAAADAAEVS